MKKILNLILALIIVSANIMFATTVYAAPLKVELYEPIGNENVQNIKSICDVEIVPDTSSADGYKIVNWTCRDEAPSTAACTPSGKIPNELPMVYCRRVQIIEGNSGSELIQSYVGTIYKWAAGTIGIVAVLVIVVSGIEIIGSDISGDIDAAKSRIGQSLIGLAILFLSAVILYTINPNFFF